MFSFIWTFIFKTKSYLDTLKMKWITETECMIVTISLDTEGQGGNQNVSSNLLILFTPLLVSEEARSFQVSDYFST